VLIQDLRRKKLINPPLWLDSNVCYLTIMGSTAYGVSADKSDFDVYGFCIPPKAIVFPHLAGKVIGFDKDLGQFDQWECHHVSDPDALAGKGRDYDFTIFSIVKYFSLLADNNPNIIDSIFTPVDCVLHSTQVGNMVRENRRMFLHKGSWHRFKGYAYSQLHKTNNRKENPELCAVWDFEDRHQIPRGTTYEECKKSHHGILVTNELAMLGSAESKEYHTLYTKMVEASARYEKIKIQGVDCHVEKETEFLTASGWKRYDDIADDEEIAGVDVATNRLVFALPIDRVSKLYTGKVYEVAPWHSRCVVTPNHQMLSSPARRNPVTNYSYSYFEDKAAWGLVPLEKLTTDPRRSWHHLRLAPAIRTEEYDVSDDYLLLAGMYLSEGSATLRPDGSVKSVRLTQTINGKAEFFTEADRLVSAFGGSRFEAKKESVWTLRVAISRRLYRDFGHGSHHKRLPGWAFRLSARQAAILWRGHFLGDGTAAKDDGEVIYTVSEKLAGDLQAMMVSAGMVCTVRGPYSSVSGFNGRPLDMYQVYRPYSDRRHACVDFKSRISRPGDGTDWPIKEYDAVDERIVCFTHPSGTLVTRSGGRAAVQGNTKFLYHVVRLMDEVEQIMTEGDIDLRRNREQLKAIRRGDMTEAEVRDHFARKEKELETLYQTSKLPHSPDVPKIRKLLLECLEAHYGNLDNYVVQPDKYLAVLRQVKDLIDQAGV
jgi:hypothetical protein